MCTYRGNVGHLMQHWTLCKLLVTASKHTTGLNFIDAHAMAPLATERLEEDARFDRVQADLSNHSGSAYERAWHSLVPNGGGYPNSAAFVKEVWKHDFSLLLCETDHATCNALKPWCQRVQDLARCGVARLFQGDWRERFARGLPTPGEARLSGEALTLVSFDPDMCSRHRGGARQRPRNLYPEDLELAMRAMVRLKGSVLIHLPTYSPNGNNPQGAVIAAVNSILASYAFTLLAVVRVNGSMMSMVYARNVPWGAELTNLPARFAEWLAAV